MFNLITETIRDMIRAVPWRKVIRLFALILVGFSGVGFFFAGGVWALYITSIWPLMLWIPALFVVAVFAAIFGDDE